MRKLKIGHKIKWNQSIVGDCIYTVLDIDLNHPAEIVTTPNGIYTFHSEILLRWQEYEGKMSERWGYSLEQINQLIVRGQISILNSEIEPYQYLPRFSFMN